MATLAANLLNQHLLEPGRTLSKRVFRALEAGEQVPLKNLSTEGGGLIRCELSLDADAFNGRLNFSAFRDGVVALLIEMTEAARNGKEFRTFAPITPDEQPAPEDTGERVFGFGGWTRHDEQTNLLMLSVQSDPSNPLLQFRLMYIDPNQFQSQSATS
jgi:hypothetical protein